MFSPRDFRQVSSGFLDSFWGLWIFYNLGSCHGLMNRVKPGVNDHINGEWNACALCIEMPCQDPDSTSEMFHQPLPFVSDFINVKCN